MWVKEGLLSKDLLLYREADQRVYIHVKVANDITGVGKFTGLKFPNAGWHSNWHSAFVTSYLNTGWHSNWHSTRSKYRLAQQLLTS